jgi:propionyl-CoA carboxylase alpha chain
MNAMGDKINSKKIAMNAGCFTIPGYQGEVESEDVAVKLAKEVSYNFLAESNQVLCR